MAYPGLNNKEVIELSKQMIEINAKPNSEKSSEYRKEIFFGKKKLARIRYFFNTVKATVKLTTEELNIIKKQYREWTIIHHIIKFQQQLSGKEIIELYELIPDLEKTPLTLTLIKDNKVPNEYKKELTIQMMENQNYHFQKDFLYVLDAKLLQPTTFWKEVLIDVMDNINNEAKNSNNLVNVDIWKGNNCLKMWCVKLNLSSLKLYNITQDESYLPNEAKDIFLF